jgi:ATP-binding cassette subfamily F protein uup
MLLSAEHISKNYGTKQLLEDVSLYMEEGEKIGIIGVNGTGKSTFLKILAGAETPAEGKLSRDPNVQLSYLPQNPVMEESATVLEQVFLHFPAEFRALKEYEAKTMLTRLGITDFDARVSTLSGGQRKRVALAAALVHPADVLLLDEPTNHLDSEMVTWLEETLRRFRGGVILVTHDRYFLERVVTKITELTHGATYSYEANYSKYLELKAQRLEMAQASERKRQSILRTEAQWIMRGARARGTKSKERIQRYHDLQNQSAPEREQRVALAAGMSRLGKQIIELEHVSLSFDGKQILSDFSYHVKRTDRIGIVGRNGAGKSTLLNLVAGRLRPDTGSVTIGATVKVGYFTQEGREMDPSQKAYDFVAEGGSRLETGEGTFSVSQLMERFLFDGALQHSEIGRLSGGERRRLYLLRILMEEPNVLLLDEPTNDLDIETLTILEDYLETFPGVVLAVSHDRYFLDKMADAIFEVRGDGTVEIYSGNYADYLDKREELQLPAEEKKAPAPAPKRQSAPAPKRKFTYGEQREYEHIEEEIAQLEQRIAEVEQQMNAASSDYVRLQELMEEKAALEEQLEQKTERWLYLEELAEAIGAQK